jgi:hypothetical protein
MDDDKNLIEKTVETIKHIAQVASDAVNHALEPEPIKPGEEVVYLPVTGGGIMGDSIMPPLIVIPRRKKSAPKQETPDTSGRITPTYDFPVPTSKMPVKKKAGEKQKPKTFAKKKTAKKSSKKNAAKKWKSSAKVAAKKRKTTGKKAVKKKKAKKAKR